MFNSFVDVTSLFTQFIYNGSQFFFVNLYSINCELDICYRSLFIWVLSLSFV